MAENQGQGPATVSRPYRGPPRPPAIPTGRDWWDFRGWGGPWWRKLAIAVAVAAVVCAAPASAQSVAFTFDDGPRLASTPLLSPHQRNQAMLDALARHKVKAALFVTCWEIFGTAYRQDLDVEPSPQIHIVETRTK